MGRLFRLTVVGVVACVGLAVPRSAGATSGTKITSAPPTVSGFVASPATLGPAGGVVTLSATVTNATTCAFTATKTAAGLTAGACTTGSVSDTVTLPPNTGTHAVTDKFRLTVTGAKTVKSAPIPVTVAAAGPPAPLSGATAIAGGSYHTCAVRTGGTVQCWGLNQYGQLGNGSTNSSYAYVSYVPVTVTGLAGVTALAAGLEHTCALLSGGTVQCWGYNDYGQLGDGTTTSSYPYGATVPVRVPGLTGVTAIAAGGDHTCALRSGGTVQCWGNNTNGELGIGPGPGPQICTVPGVATYACSTTPVNVSGLTGVTAISAGLEHTCALLSGGTVQCWGDSSHGALGSSAANYYTPVAVGGAGCGCGTLTGVTAVTAGGFHTCAVRTGATVDCWGDNRYGELGTGVVSPVGPYGTTTPTPVVGLGGGALTGVAAISLGTYHTCAVLTGGTVDCWGANGYGQAGTGSHGISSVHPTAVIGLQGVGTLGGVASIVAGYGHTCAVLTAGTVDCWGYNRVGELGNGAHQSANPTPTPVRGS